MATQKDLTSPPIPSKPIPYGKTEITELDIQAVNETLRSDFLTQGPKVKEFEDAFAKYVGCKFAVAVANGTAALHLCTLALEFQEGDKVITTPITFAASANCIRYTGAEVLFADIDPATYLIDIQAVTKLLEAKDGHKIKGIIPVDFAGRAVPLEDLKPLVKKYGIKVIEDACHSPGGYYLDETGNRQQCGNGYGADLAVFSFHPVKHIATGEGGMITTNDERLYKKLLLLRTHGISRDPQTFVNSAQFATATSESSTYPGWYMEMQTLGFNYRLTDFQSALGLSQLKRASIGLERRREIAKRYYESFSGKSYIKGQSGVVEGHAYHLYVIEVDDRLGLYNFLRSKNIYTQIHYIPCHLMPYYRALGWKEGDLPHAERYYQQCLSLPIFATLTEDEQSYIINCVEEYYRQ